MEEVFSFPSNSKIEVRIGNCLDLIETEPNIYHSIICDPPYEIGLHRKSWDSTGIAFSNELWSRLFHVLRPGGFVAAFAAPRLYHRMAVTVEDCGFEMYPFMTWKFDGGLPKPANLSELFDRDNIETREIIGYRAGSGFTSANVAQGAQERTHTQFPVYARHVSPEARQWKDWLYGVNVMKPCQEAILLAQKPIQTARMIDNVRQWGVGALNIGALKARSGNWPTTIFEHKKARKADHQSDHPSVKPVPLMVDLCELLTPPGGLILDPFAGTGTTGVAANRCGFDCILIEQNPEMESVIRRRINS